MNYTDDPRESFIITLLPLLTLDDLTQQQIYNALEVRQYDRKQMLMVNGKPGDRISFLHSGLGRGFYKDEREREINSWFAAENDFIVPPYDMPDRQPTLESVEFLEKSVVVWLTRKKLYEFSGQHPAIVVLEPFLQNLHLTQYVEWTRMFHLYKGEERYDWFMVRYGHIKSRLTLKDISSFLKLDTATVSRIRRRKSEGRKKA